MYWGVNIYLSLLVICVSFVCHIRSLAGSTNIFVVIVVVVWWWWW